jgi:hypothetical protein
VKDHNELTAVERHQAASVSPPYQFDSKVRIPALDGLRGAAILVTQTPKTKPF